MASLWPERSIRFSKWCELIDHFKESFRRSIFSRWNHLCWLCVRGRRFAVKLNIKQFCFARKDSVSLCWRTFLCSLSELLNLFYAWFTPPARDKHVDCYFSGHVNGWDVHTAFLLRVKSVLTENSWLSRAAHADSVKSWSTRLVFIVEEFWYGTKTVS